MPKDVNSQYKKVRVKNGALFHFKKHLSGSTKPVLAKRNDKDSYYVIKKSGCNDFYQSILEESNRDTLTKVQSAARKRISKKKILKLIKIMEDIEHKLGQSIDFSILQVDDKKRLIQQFPAGICKPGDQALVSNIIRKAYALSSNNSQDEYKLQLKQLIQFMQVLLEKYQSQDEKEEELDKEMQNYEYYFLQRKDYFILAFMHLFAPECIPTPVKFYKLNPNSHVDVDDQRVGIKFLPEYSDWQERYKNNKIDDCAIDEQGYVLKESIYGLQRKPIMGLGYCAVLTVILLISDMHQANWGLIDRGDHYQAVIVDPLEALNGLKEQFMPVANARDILKKAFYSTNNNVPRLAPELYDAEYIHEEIYKAIFDLNNLMNAKHLPDSLEKILKDDFKKYPDFNAAMINEIKDNIKDCYEQTKMAANEFFNKKYHLPTGEASSAYAMYEPIYENETRIENEYRAVHFKM